MSKHYTVAHGLGVFHADGRPNTDPITVPDGKWVLETTSHSSQEWSDDGGDDGFTGPGYDNSSWRQNKVVGPEPATQYLLGKNRDHQHWTGGSSTRSSSRKLLVGDQPFGVITEEREGSDPLDRGGLYFSCARQIHKGELGRRPQIARPKFVREAADHFMYGENRDGRPVSPRNLRRGKKGWAQLSEVAALVGMTTEEVIWRYFAFTDCESPAPQVIFGDREQIAGQKLKPGQIARFNVEQLPQLFYHDPAKVWIRQGFALTILYLKHFGYIPELPIAATPALPPEESQTQPEAR